MDRHFFGKEIEVRTEGELPHPSAFKLDEKWHDIEVILTSWPDYGMPSDGRTRHRWWQRHHRNYYRVRTTEGEVFEIYYDRGVSLGNEKYRKWYVTKRF
ncbi:MAG: DUF6504 family protein [Chloroflexi bacterium]|nr:DUF6504 family protein [Chloroflexota bacterium]